MKRLRKDKKKILSRDDAYDLLKPFHDDCFMPSIQFGLNAYAGLAPDFRSQLTARTKANILNDCISRDLERRLAGESAVKTNDDLGFKVFVFDARAAIRVKKVDHRQRPHNHRSGQQTEIEFQRELPGIPTATYVTLGYHLDALWDKILWVKLICRENGECRWAIPVSVDPIQAHLFPDAPADQQQKKPRVRAKARKESEA